MYIHIPIPKHRKRKPYQVVKVTPGSIFDNMKKTLMRLDTHSRKVNTVIHVYA